MLRKLALAALAALGSPTALGVIIPPGGAAALPGSGMPGTVLVDTLTPFQIHSAGGALLFQGVLQNRVNRDPVSNTLRFSVYVRDTVPGLNGLIQRIETIDFADYPTDVDWCNNCLGQVAPTMGLRSGAPGQMVTFHFNTPVVSGQASKFCYILTDAAQYGPGGLTTIRLTTGETIAIPTWRPVSDSTPPVVAITSPTPLDCGCNPITILGTANDPEGFDSYDLEYSLDPGGPWTLLASGNAPVVNGVLGVWNTGPLAQGFYFVRLTAVNDAGMTSIATTMIFVDRVFDIVDVRSPLNAMVVGGEVCLDGTVWDRCPNQYTARYRPVGGAYLPVDPGNPVYFGNIINDPYAVWNTRVGPASVPDGTYELETRGTDECGQVGIVTRTVVVDNTAPIAVITSPDGCSHRCGVVQVIGTAIDAHLGEWALYYTGGDAHGWVPLASGNAPVINGVLANWNTAGLVPCSYTLRLIVTDTSVLSCGPYRNQSEYTVSFNVGAYADCNADGVLDVSDFGCFSNKFILGCP